MLGAAAEGDEGVGGAGAGVGLRGGDLAERLGGVPGLLAQLAPGRVHDGLAGVDEAAGE